MDQTTLSGIKPITSGGIRGEVLTRILDLILKGEIREGARLVVQKLATQMGVSTTPVREALVQLAEIGVVKNIPNRGAICRRFGPDELREIYVIRRILEEEATRTFSVESDDKSLIKIRNGLQKVLDARPEATAWENASLAALDGQLHSTIATGCGNKRLNHEIQRSWFLMRHIRSLIRAEQKQEPSSDTRQHIAIIDALLAGSQDLAAELMGQHIKSSCEFAIECLFSHAESE